MQYSDLKIFAWIFLIENKKVFLLKKRTNKWEIRVLPFFDVRKDQAPQKVLIHGIKDLLNIDTKIDNLINPLVVNKARLEKKETSMWYFPICISWKGKIQIADTEIYKWFERYNFQNLPKSITEDTKKIIQAMSDEKSYFEL